MKLLQRQRVPILACQCPGKKNIELVLVMTAACVGFREPLGVDTNRRTKRVARVFLPFGCGFGFAGSVFDSWWQMEAAGEGGWVR